MSGLSHINAKGEAHMVDVATREVMRTAVATGTVHTAAAAATTERACR
jgi:molybdenum cofactor biosynthesis enzyme